MTRNHLFDSDDPALASGDANINDAEFCETGSTDYYRPGDRRAGQAAPQPHPATHTSSGHADAPTSKNDKRRNLPR